MNKCFGIVSWFPTEEAARQQRQKRINNLFKQLNDLWPDIDILVIAQDWKDFKPIKTKNKQIIKYYDQLGILKARQTLRDEFLKLNYEYIIMFDDDAHIKTKNDAHIKYMEEVDKHKDGFCFMRREDPTSGFDPYVPAQLNLCAISKYIYSCQPFPDIDPQKDEGFEDSIYACLLHHKYSTHEFTPPTDIKCTQFGDAGAPSTWAYESKRPWQIINGNTNRIKKYISEHGDLPENYRKMLLKPVKQPKQLADGRLGTYLSF